MSSRPPFVAGEAVFIPTRASGGAGDGGWLLNYVSDRTNLTTDLVLLDAGTLDEVARVHLIEWVPFGFHGNWLAACISSIVAPFRWRRAFGG